MDTIYMSEELYETYMGKNEYLFMLSIFELQILFQLISLSENS